MTGDDRSHRRNWAGNVTYQARRFHQPRSLDELAAVVVGSERVRVLGSRHSFNDLADTTGDLVSLAALPRRFEIDREHATATVVGGARYGELCDELDREGVALPNLASLPHLSVAGACATGTHGSGVRLQSLAGSVIGLELLRADGETVRLSRQEGGAFLGAVVSLGALGVVTKLELAVEPAYRMRQDVYEDCAFDLALANFDEILTAADSVSLLTDWRQPAFHQVWLKRRLPAAEPPPGSSFHGARPATRRLHPIAGMPPDACTEQLGIPGPWHDRLPHFRLDHTPSSGTELQSEYLVRRADGAASLEALAGVRTAFAGLVQVSEVRTVAADDLWLSPTFGRDSVAVHFTWVLDWPAVRQALTVIEGALAPFDARPHWGKLFTMPADELRARYPRLPDFVALAAQLDPHGRFRNAFLERHVFAP